jgi:tetratricopeptide (TPR) repeat protein
LKNSFSTPLLILILISFFLSVSLAQSGVDYFFDRGNQSYRNGNYTEAIEHYQKILDTGYESGKLYYNLGNCYYKLDKIGYAILYYEKSRKFLPNDPEVDFNLELARLKVIDRIEMPPRFFLFEWWDTLKHFYSISQLTHIAIGAYILTAMVLILYLFLKTDRIRRLLFSLFSIFLILTLFSGYFLWANIHEEKSIQYGVLLSPNASVLSAPDENGTEVFILHEGVKVKLADERENWLKIMLPDGKSGWIKKDYLGVI